MPHDLFGDMPVRPPSVRSRRSSVVAFSIVAHGAALAAVVIVPLLASTSLPLPQRALAYFTPSDLVVPVVPPPRRVSIERAEPAKLVARHDIAPTVVPDGIAPERFEHTLGGIGGSDGPPSIGTFDGIGPGGIGV